MTLVGDKEAERDIRGGQKEGVSAQKGHRGEMSSVQADWIKGTHGCCSGRGGGHACAQKKPEGAKGECPGLECRAGWPGWKDRGSLRHSHRSCHTHVHTPTCRSCRAVLDYSKCAFPWQHRLLFPGHAGGTGRGGQAQPTVCFSAQKEMRLLHCII